MKSEQFILVKNGVHLIWKEKRSKMILPSHSRTNKTNEKLLLIFREWVREQGMGSHLHMS